MGKGGMREQMPQTARFIDGLREAFGADQVDPSIRAGMRGEPRFYATENGHELGCAATLADPARCVEVGVEMPAQWTRKVAR